MEFIALFAAALAFGTVGNLLQCMDMAQCEFLYFHNWKLHYFLFSYEDLGFAKRALLGTILGLDPETTTRDLSMRLIALAIFFGFAGLMVLLAGSAPLRIRVLLVASPAVFLQAGFDLARIDHLNYILLLAILLSGSLSAILLAPALVLLHEGAILIHLPLLFAAHWLIYGPTRALTAAVALSAAAAAATATLGRLDPAVDVRAIYPGLDWQISELTKSVASNVRETLRWVDLAGLTFVAVSGVMAAYVAMLFATLRNMMPRETIFGAPIRLVVFSPLIACVFAMDWGRWFSYTVINMFILVFVNLLLLNKETDGGGASPGVDRWRRPALAMTLLGPFGIVLPIPLLYELKALVFG